MSDLANARAIEATGEVLVYKINLALLEADMRRLEKERQQVREGSTRAKELLVEIEEVGRRIGETTEKLRHAETVALRLALLLARQRISAYAWERLFGQSFEVLGRPFIGPVQPGRFLGQRRFGFRVR